LDVNMQPCNNKAMKGYGSLGLGYALLFFSALVPIHAVAADAVLPEGTRISLQLNDQLSTKTNGEGDDFEAIVTMPVHLGDRMAIPKGSVVTGSISRIQRPGRFKGKAVMKLQFQSIIIAGHGQLPIVASLAGVDRQGAGAVNNEGTIQGKGSAGKDFGRVLKPGLIGAGIGTIAGGGKGAGIGAGVGAAAGLATVFVSRGRDIELRRGAMLDISLDKPLQIPSEGDHSAEKSH
jgi:hypothetical protein